MQNKELKQLTIVEQVEQVMNMDNLKQEMRLNDSFELDFRFEISITDLLKYGADVAVQGDFSLSYHNSVMKLRNQLEKYVIPASRYDFFNQKLYIYWNGIKQFIMTDYQLFIDEVLDFAQRLDSLNIQGLTLSKEGVVFSLPNQDKSIEFRALQTDDFEKDLDEPYMDYNHLYQMCEEYILKHSLDGTEPIKMTYSERREYQLKLFYEFYRIDNE